MNLTTGIYAIFRGLNFESNEELGKNGRLWINTN